MPCTAGCRARLNHLQRKLDSMKTLTRAELCDLIARIKRMRGPHLGDGINPGITTTELLAALLPMLDSVAEPVTGSPS